MMADSLDPHTLETVAAALERRSGNELYRKAWRAAARLVRSMMPAKVNQQSDEVNRQP